MPSLPCPPSADSIVEKVDDLIEELKRRVKE